MNEKTDQNTDTNQFTQLTNSTDTETTKLSLKEREESEPKSKVSLSRRVGIIVRHYRRSIGLTQQELASACGIQQATLSHIERGKSCCLPTLDRIADQLGVPLYEIIRKADRRNSNSGKVDPRLQEFADHFKF